MAILQIPNKKVPGEYTQVNTDHIPNDSMIELVKLGLDVALHRRMSNQPSATYMKGLAEAAEAGDTDAANELAGHAESGRKIAQENLQKILKGEMTTRKAAASKVSKEERKAQTLALNNARAKTRDWIVAQGKRISHFKASQITEAAKQYLEAHPEMLDEARAAIAAAEAKPTEAADLAIFAKLSESPDAVKREKAARAKAKAKRDEDKVLSAATADKVAPRRRPDPVLHS
jgi:hypothetical protein